MGSVREKTAEAMTEIGAPGDLRSPAPSEFRLKRAVHQDPTHENAMRTSAHRSKYTIESTMNTHNNPIGPIARKLAISVLTLSTLAALGCAADNTDSASSDFESTLRVETTEDSDTIITLALLDDEGEILAELSWYKMFDTGTVEFLGGEVRSFVDVSGIAADLDGGERVSVLAKALRAEWELGEPDTAVVDVEDSSLSKTAAVGGLGIEDDPQASGGAGCSMTMAPGQSLLPGQELGCGSRYRFVHQTDGNLVAYLDSTPVWQSVTWGQSTTTLTMQTDGNLVLYGPGGAVRWATGTWDAPGAHFTSGFTDADGDGIALWLLLVSGDTGTKWVRSGVIAS